MWRYDLTKTVGGRFRVVITAPGRDPVDVTMFRGAPVQIGSYSSADPFGDAACSLVCPSLTAFDGPADVPWAVEGADVDIWWVPGYDRPATWPDAFPDDIMADDGTIKLLEHDLVPYYNELTGQVDQVAPAHAWQKVSGNWVPVHPLRPRGTKVWEGFVTNIGVSAQNNADTVTLECQGALFQGDHYKAKPAFPPRPIPLEALVLAQFDRHRHRNLRTSEAKILWPDGWTLKSPSYDKDQVNYFTPDVKPNVKWSGYTSRSTGSWDAALTSFIQNCLAEMLVQPGSGTGPGTTEGSQWTLRMRREGDHGSPGRQPVLTVRDTADTSDFSMWVGTPGLTVSLNRDDSQTVDVIYGQGTDGAGSQWANSALSAGGRRTSYRALAAKPDSYPTHNNRRWDRDKMVREQYVAFGSGFSQVDGVQSAQQMLARAGDPGWAGSITLAIDPSADLSRWAIQAGMQMTLQGWRGSGTTGLKLHIAQVEASPQQGTVTLTVDSLYRDLLTLQQAIARTLDPLTPSKLLQLNKNSVTIEDLQAPWDYSAGAGFCPKRTREFHAYRRSTMDFPYEEFTKQFPPAHHKHLYVPVDAKNSDSKKRWSAAVPILTSERGTIVRTEFSCHDRWGRLLPIRFHVSLYYHASVTYLNMPHVGGNYSPFQPNMFQSTDPRTGQQWDDQTNRHPPDGSFIMGWGNGEQPAGYSPGVFRGADGQPTGNKPTGMLVDESTWPYDCTTGHAGKYNQKATQGVGDGPNQVNPLDITIYAMFYVDQQSEPVYFLGRLFRQNPGAST